MPFVAVTRVNLAGRDQAEGRRQLEEVLVPRIKARPGFLTARFLRSLDGTTGVGAVLFDTEANARAGVEAVTTDRPAESPPVVSTEILEVVLEV